MSYSGITTTSDSDLFNIIQDLCEDDYYPVGLNVQDIKKDNTTEQNIINRDICVPKNNLHGYQYNPINITNDKINKDFFIKAGDPGTAKTFSDIIEDNPEMVTARCAPPIRDGNYNNGTCELSTVSEAGAEAAAGPCHQYNNNKEDCDKADDYCEWWPQYSCKKAGDKASLNDFIELEDTIKDNLISNSNNKGWPQAPQGERTSSAGVECTEGKPCYVSIPIGNDHIPRTPRYDQINNVNDKLINGVQIPITELHRGKEPDWPNADGNQILENFPLQISTRENIDLNSLNIDVKDASRIIIKEDGKLNPDMQSCRDYFISNNSYYNPQVGEAEAELYCKRNLDDSIKGSFYYGNINNENNIIDLVEPSPAAAAAAPPAPGIENTPISKNTNYCGTSSPFLMRVAQDGDNDNYFYVCTNCHDLGNYGWEENNQGKCVNNSFECKCTNQDGNDLSALGAVPAASQHCKWVKVGEKWELRGCAQCPNNDEYYLSYADGAQIGLERLTKDSFPSRTAGDYPDEYSHARNNEYEYVAWDDCAADEQPCEGGGIFQPGDGGWAYTAYNPPRARLLNQILTHGELGRGDGGLARREQNIDPIYAVTEFDMELVDRADGDGQHFIAKPIPRLPDPSSSQRVEEALLRLNDEGEEVQDPNDWYHHTICRTKRYGTKEWNNKEAGGRPASYGGAGYLDPRFYETQDLESKCSHDTVFHHQPLHVPDDPRAWKGECVGDHIECCNSSDCGLWNTKLTAAGGTDVDDEGKPRVLLDEGSGQIKPKYLSEVYAWRGRCLKTDGQPCTTPVRVGDDVGTGECYGGYCCDGVCSSTECPDIVDQVGQAAAVGFGVCPTTTCQVARWAYCFFAEDGTPGCP